MVMFIATHNLQLRLMCVQLRAEYVRGTGLVEQGPRDGLGCRPREDLQSGLDGTSNHTLASTADPIESCTYGTRTSTSRVVL